MNLAVQFRAHLGLLSNSSTSPLAASMRSLHTFICCCLFSSVLALERNSKTDADTILKKRFAVWLQGRVKRELCHSCARSSEPGPQPQGEARHEEGPEALALQQRLTDRSSRSSGTKKSGCQLITCTVHDLIFWVHQINDRTIDPTAPADKIGSRGYGRRRRSLKRPSASRPTTHTRPAGPHTAPHTLS
ncbi:hypothetical protein CRUP_001974 [Coryphaenoides rupestris]|nr:hypothetical protein CRUP_001974 [Coryphaenoides rupestris]